MTTRRDQLREDSHFRILRLLQENPELSQRDLARAVGVSNGGIHYVLSALLDKGLIKLGNFTAADDKRRYAYVLIGGENECSNLDLVHMICAILDGKRPRADDRAEEEEAIATTINADAPGAMARQCASLGIPLVHISTDYVFDGGGTAPWHSDDSPSPQNAYGRSKLAGDAPSHRRAARTPSCAPRGCSRRMVPISCAPCCGSRKPAMR